MLKFLFSIFLLFCFSVAHADQASHWIKVKAKNKYERSRIANVGVSIEIVKDDYVIAIGTRSELNILKRRGLVESSYALNSDAFDFPSKDANFHNYKELTEELQKLAADNKDIAAYEVIGKSLEGRDIFNIRISTDLSNSSKKPAILFLGTHHAREHISTEMPLQLAQYLVSEYKKGTKEVVDLVTSREIHIIPLVNPDGSEYDVSTGSYKSWRKNRRNTNGSAHGVDLNRNYGYKWGTGGSSTNKSSDTYMGEKPFSEPETQVVKKFVEDHQNINILLSFHTFSQLILYPWGNTYDPIEDAKALKVHEVMAKTMAQWNGYKPQQSSDLYIASGDTVDWAFGEHKIVAFTFELDPGSIFGGGFYPGQKMIPVVFQKNLKPCLYLIEYADNPYRVLESKAHKYGLTTGLIR